MFCPLDAITRIVAHRRLEREHKKALGMPLCLNVRVQRELTDMGRARGQADCGAAAWKGPRGAPDGTPELPLAKRRVSDRYCI
jgi:hypothetical protein